MKIKTFYDPPADDFIVEQSDWEHALFIIERTLKDFENNPAEAAEFYSARGLPFLSWFKHSLNCRINLHNASFASHREFKPTFAALEALCKLQDLLNDNGGISPERAKIFLLSFQILLGCLRSGIGLTRENQLHAPKKKKNKYVLKYCSELMSLKQSSSARHLFLRFPADEKKAVIIDEVRIFRDFSESGEEKIVCIKPDGKRMELGERAFAGYFKESKKSMNVNS
jgi:hypothetical protein